MILSKDGVNHPIDFFGFKRTDDGTFIIAISPGNSRKFVILHDIEIYSVGRILFDTVFKNFVHSMLTIIIIKRFYFNFNLARGTFAAGRNNFAVRCFSSLDCVLPVTVRYPLRNDRFIDIISGKRISQILKRIYSIVLTALRKSKGIPCPFSDSTPEVVAECTCS